MKIEDKFDETLLLLTHVKGKDDRKEITERMISEFGPYTDRLLERQLIAMGSKRYEAYFKALLRPDADHLNKEGVEKKLLLNNQLFFLTTAGYQRVYELGRVNGYHGWRGRRLADGIHTRLTLAHVPQLELSYMDTALVTKDGVHVSYVVDRAERDENGDWVTKEDISNRKFALAEFEQGMYYTLLYYMANQEFFEGHLLYYKTGELLEHAFNRLLRKLSERWQGATGYSLKPTVIKAIRTMKSRPRGLPSLGEESISFIKLFA